MGPVRIPLTGPDAVEKTELPQCAWCGERSKTICGRCKTRAYCSTECQRLDWRSGHQTACVEAAPKAAPVQEDRFEYWRVPYVAHWAINMRRWKISRESKEFAFLLAKIDDEEVQKRISEMKPLSAAKVALAKELAVRRMAEVLLQASWKNVSWKCDPVTGREYLTERPEYIWTGNKYENSKTRFPNFNFSFSEAGEYLFVASHPAALCGIYAGAPVRPPMPDPRVEFMQLWRREATMAAQAGSNSEEPAADSAQRTEGAGPEAAPPPEPPDATGNPDPGLTPAASPTPARNEVEAAEDSSMFTADEISEICEPEDEDERRRRLRHAIVGKMAYFHTVGRTEDRPWNQVVVSQATKSETVQVGAKGGAKRHALIVGGVAQRRWRCDSHSWRGHCVMVCRGPPEDAIDPNGEFVSTLALRFPEVDNYDDIMDLVEPPFMEVPIKRLLPDKWQSDYTRACGLGEKGDTLRFNR